MGTKTGEASLSSMVPQLPSRIPSLDGLRAVSILFVVIGHAHYSHRAPAVLRHFEHLGNVGVRCFFIISGLLITTLLLKENQKAGTISLKRFYFRRSLRIFPPSLAYIGVIAVLSSAGLIALAPHDLLHALTYTMNYQIPRMRTFWLDHLWSLSVEEQFYLLWPSVLVLFGVRRGAKIAWSVIVAAPIVRIIMWLLLGASASAMTKQFQVAADALAAGCVLAMSYNWLSTCERYRSFQLSIWFLPSALALIGVGNLMFVASPASFYLIGQTLANVGTAIAIDWLVRRPSSWFGALLNSKPMVYVGTLSYSLYLWQNFFLNDERTPWRVSFPFNIFCVFGLAMVSYYFIEKPFLGLKRYEEKIPALRS